MIPCGVGEMSSRTACKTGFWWRYQNNSDNAIATNKHIIQIFPFIARSAKYPWSSDLRSSSITVTLTYSANDIRTYSKTLYTKYNWGNVPTESDFSNLNNIGTKLCGLVQSDNNLAGEQSTYHSGYRGFSCKNASNFSEYCSYTRTSNTYPYADPQGDNTIYGAQFEVPCNNDGTPPTVKVKWNMAIYSGHGTISYETNIGLDTIPRASTITQSNSNFVIVKASTASTSESNTITISKYSNTFAHKLLFKIDSYTYVGNVTNNTSSSTESYTITPKNINDILDLMKTPSNLNKTVNVICYTYPNVTTRNNDTQNNGAGSIGNKTLSFIIKMEQNDNTKPVVNTPVAPTISNPFTVSSTNYALVGRSYLSGIKATLNSTKYRADYSKTYINLSTGENWTITDNGATTKSGNIISSVSNIVITAKVVDSRGFESDAKTYTFPSSSIKNYNIPSLVENNIYRSDSNGGVYLKVSVLFSKIDISGDKNVNKVIKVTDNVGNTYTCTWNGSTASGGSYNSSTGVLTMEKNLTGYTITNTYTFTIQFYDAVLGSGNPVTTTKGIGTVEDLMNFNENGKSMAIGGISTRGSSEKALDVFIPAYLQSGGQFSGTQGGTWIKSRNVAYVRDKGSSSAGYRPLISSKTPTGEWSIGNHNDENLVFSYTTDANYNANNNASNRYTLSTGGKFSGSCASADSATTWSGNTALTNDHSTLNTSDTWIPVIASGKIQHTLRKFASSKTHTDYNNNQSYIPTMSFLTYWNGAYNSSNSSNLTYCAKGEIGIHNACCTLKSTSRYTKSATAWAVTDVEYSGRSTFTNSNSNYFEQSGNGIKCKFNGWIQVNVVIYTDIGTEFNSHIYKGSTDVMGCVNTTGKMSLSTSVVQVANGDIIYSKFTTGKTSSVIYENSNITIIRIS